MYGKKMPKKKKGKKHATQRVAEATRRAEASGTGGGGPAVTDYGTIAPDIIKKHKVMEMESRMDTNERKQYHAVRTAKYGYPPVK